MDNNEITSPDEEKKKTLIRKSGFWAFWIGILFVISGIIIFVILIGVFYYRLGSIKLPPECYVSNKDIGVAKAAKKYLRSFEIKKGAMSSLLCKDCSSCTTCPDHTAVLNVPVKPKITS